MICEVLRSEVRSTYRRAKGGAEPYRFQLESLRVECAFDDSAREARVTAVEWLPQGTPPGDLRGGGAAAEQEGEGGLLRAGPAAAAAAAAAARAAAGGSRAEEGAQGG